MHYWNVVLDEVLHKRENKRAFLFTNYGRLDEEMDFYTSHFNLSDAAPRSVRTYYLGDQYPDLYLTKREAECMFWFIQDCTLTETGLKMGLSPRTIEFYTKNLKIKMGCKTKKELIANILKTTLLQQLADEGMCVVRH